MIQKQEFAMLNSFSCNIVSMIICMVNTMTLVYVNHKFDADNRVTRMGKGALSAPASCSLYLFLSQDNIEHIGHFLPL